MFSQGIHGMIRPWTVRESELNGSSSVVVSSSRVFGSPEDEQLIDSSLRANRSSSWIDPSSRLSVATPLRPTGAAAATSGTRCSKLDDIESTKGGRADSALILCGSNGGGSSLRVSLSLGCTSSGLIGARLPRIWTGNCCKHSTTSLPTHSWMTKRRRNDNERKSSDNKSMRGILRWRFPCRFSARGFAAGDLSACVSAPTGSTCFGTWDVNPWKYKKRKMIAIH